MPLPSNSEIFDRVIQLLKRYPGDLTTKTLTEKIYGENYTAANYNYISRYIGNLTTNGKIQKNGRYILLLDRNIKPYQLIKEGDLPFKVPQLLKSIQSIQSLIDRDKYLQRVLRSIGENVPGFRAGLTEVWPDDLPIESILILTVELLAYLNMFMDTADTPCRFFDQFKAEGELLAPEEIIKRLEYLTA